MRVCICVREREKRQREEDDEFSRKEEKYQKCRKEYRQT
jgi:hypothetical protein